MKRIRKKNRGFTLVEVLVVLGILSALFAIFMPTLSSQGQRSKITEAQFDLMKVVSAVQECRAGIGNYTGATWSDIEDCLPDGFDRTNPFGQQWDFTVITPTSFEVRLDFDTQDMKNKYVRSLTPGTFREEGTTTVWHPSS